MSEIKNRKLVSINVLRYDNSELIAKIELGETMKREDKLDLILNRLDKMESDFNSRLDKMESDFNSRLDKVDSRLDKIESDVSQLKTKAINHGWNIK